VDKRFVTVLLALRGACVVEPERLAGRRGIAATCVRDELFSVIGRKSISL
jgi:hypothetical protein